MEKKKVYKYKNKIHGKKIHANLSNCIKDIVDEESINLADEIMKVVNKKIEIESNDEYTYTYVRVAALSRLILNMKNISYDEQTKRISSLMR